VSGKHRTDKQHDLPAAWNISTKLQIHLIS